MPREEAMHPANIAQQATGPQQGAVPATLRWHAWSGQHQRCSTDALNRCCLETEKRLLTWEVMARRKAVHATVVVQYIGRPEQRQRQPR